VIPRWAAGVLFLVAAIAAGLVAFLATAQIKAATAGWLAAFVFWCGPPIGSLVWMMIHRLTGGRLGFAFGPHFAATAVLIPLMAVLLIPVLFAMPALYPWMRGGNDVIQSVAHIYLNPPAFIVRSVIAFAGWTVLALALPRLHGGGATLLAALGLVFYGVLISLVPVDWILSLEHPFISESFGASVAVTHLMAALAWAALLAPRESEAVTSDLGALLLAMVLSITYIDFMALLVIWYGDLPDKVFWFTQRTHFPWSVLAYAAFICGSALPIILLLFSCIRANRGALRIIGAIVLFGLAVYDIYLVVPPFGLMALLAATLGILAIGCLVLGLSLVSIPAMAPGQRGSHVR
jgi:hypothetical protein